MTQTIEHEQRHPTTNRSSEKISIGFLADFTDINYVCPPYYVNIVYPIILLLTSIDPITPGHSENSIAVRVNSSWRIIAAHVEQPDQGVILRWRTGFANEMRGAVTKTLG